MRTRPRRGIASAVLTGTAALALLGGTAMTAGPGAARAATPVAAVGTAADHAHDTFQPAYARQRVVTYQPILVEQKSPAPRQHPLYEVEYPKGWEKHLARPLCTYCDHNGNGKDAYDFHDHVLGELPTWAENDSGNVFWRVNHVSPAYTGDARHDALVTQRYAALLPATSAWQVRRLLGARLADGTPVAENLDTKYYFRGPLTRWPSPLTR